MSVLSTAYTGLNAFQRALDVTGNNITNALTKGYSRQTLNLDANPTQFYSGTYVGSGVAVNSITRNVDEFANFQVRNTISAKSQFDAFYQQSVQIDKLLSQNGVSLSSSMQSFFDSMGQLNNAPDSSSARNIALKQGQLLTQQFTFLQDKLDEYQANSTAQITESVKQINSLTAGVARMNQQLMASPNSPALLDQRDKLLNDLSQFVDLTIYQQSDGTMNVALNSGDMVVTGTSQKEFSVSAGRSNSFGTQIILGSGPGKMDVTDKISSGTLGGLMDFEQNVLSPATQMIGQIAIGFSLSFNTQHQLGMDMNNEFGKNFFTDFNSTLMQTSTNRSFSTTTGTTATLNVAISDIASTQLSDYELSIIDSSHAQLTRKSDGTVFDASSLLASTPVPVIQDGLTISLNTGSFQAGDRFTLTPTRGAAGQLNLLISDIRDLATAAPIAASANIQNAGTGSMAFKQLLATSDTDKASIKANSYVVAIDPSDASKYAVVLSSAMPPASYPGTLVPNSDNEILIPDSSSPLYSVTLSGIPKAGDQFTTAFNTDGFGDNRNGLALSAVQQNKVFTGGTESVFDRYSSLIGNVGSQTNDAKLRGASADILYSQAVDFQASKSGVNLDEEAANLLKYKQAYEAAGKLMQISNEMMQIVFDMIR